MKKKSINGILLLFLSVVTFNANAQNNYFTDKAEATFKGNDKKRITIPEKYRTVQLNYTDMQNFLSGVK